MKRRFIVLTVCLALLTGVLPAAYADEATAPETALIEDVTQTVTLSDLGTPTTDEEVEDISTAEPSEAPADPTDEPEAAPVEEATDAPADPTDEPTAEPTAVPTPTMEPAPIVTIISRIPVLEGTTAATNAEKVNIRMQPDTASDVLYQIEDEDTAVTPVDVVTLSDDSIWYSIEYTDADENVYSGYIFSELLDVQEPVEATPAPTAAPVISAIESEGEDATEPSEAPTDETAPETTEAAPEEPVTTDEPTATPADTEEAQTEEEQAFLTAVDNVKIAISVVSCADENGVLMYGDTIKLSATIPEELSGATMQWQQTDENGEWFDLPDATEDALTLVLCSENMSASWRIHFVQE